jgi:polyisoprenoid-binding protein YceI
MSLVFVAVLAPSQQSLAAEHPVDPHHSAIRIHVGKAGLFSAAGHEHWVTAPVASGAVEEDEPRHIFFTVQAKSMTVEPDKDLKPEQQAEVQRTMQDKVLESAQYPEISFRSSSVERAGADTFVVKGDLTLHGQVHPVSATVHRQGNAYVGTCRFKQTTFGIRPVNVGGVVKVKDELEIQFSVVPASGETE